MADPLRRSLLTAIALSPVSVGLTACTPWGWRNEKPSEEALQAIDALDAALRKLPGVRAVNVRFQTKAMQEHEIIGRVDLHPDLPAADLVAFGTGAHQAVQASQVDPYVTYVSTSATINDSDLDWSIVAGSEPDRYPAAIDGGLGEISRGAWSTRIVERVDMDKMHLMSYWHHLDETSLLAATPTGVQQVSRVLWPGVIKEKIWVTIVMREGQPAADLPYQQALADLTPVLQSSTTTLGIESRRWLVQFPDQEVDAPALMTAVTAFLRTLRAAGGRWDEIEFQYPWHVMLAIDGEVRVSHWIDGNSDRAAAEPVVSKVLVAANQV